MKNFGVTTVLTLGMAACTSPQSTCEQAIVSYVQTDKHGTLTDLKFEILSLETSERTVADSIELHKADDEKELAKQIESEESKLEFWKQLIADNPQSRDVERYNENIDGINRRIDSLKQTTPEEVLRYTGLAPDLVIGIIAKLWYSYVMPETGARKERTDTFILSADGKEVFGQEPSAD